jgi:hypothetical protein
MATVQLATRIVGGLGNEKMLEVLELTYQLISPRGEFLAHGES